MKEALRITYTLANEDEKCRDCVEYKMNRDIEVQVGRLACKQTCRVDKLEDGYLVVPYSGFYSSIRVEQIEIKEIY